MLTESTKKLRDPLALALLAAAVLYLLATLALLFKDELFGEFADRAFFFQDEFTNPVWVLVVLAALALVASSDRPSPMARTVAMAALAVLGLMLLLGVVSWLAGYGSEDAVDFVEGTGKLTWTLYALARLLLLAVAAFLAYHVFKSLPAPARQAQRGQQQWGQPGQQQWGQPGQQGPYGQQGQGQWAGPAVGAGAAGAAGYAAGSEQPGWGQQDPYAAPPASGQSSAGYAAGGEQAPWDQQHGAYAAPPASGQSSAGYAAGGEQQAWGQPQQDQQQAWGQRQQDQQQAWGQPQQDQQAWAQPASEQQESWGQPQQQDQQWAQPAQPPQEQQAGWDQATQTWDQQPSGESSDPEATVVREPNASAESGEPDAQSGEQPAREDDDRPGWWAPGS